MLLLACSALKSRDSGSCPAREMYTGALIRKGMQWADKTGTPFLILSARYGLIKPDQVIEAYNQKLKRPYQGPWPDEGGFYLGGQLYFSRAPERFHPLVPALPIGMMLRAMNTLLAGGDPWK